MSGVRRKLSEVTGANGNPKPAVRRDALDGLLNQMVTLRIPALPKDFRPRVALAGGYTQNPLRTNAPNGQEVVGQEIC